MQRGLVFRTTQADGGADEQREQAHSRQHEVHRVAAWIRRQGDVEHLLGAETVDRVGDPCASGAASLDRGEVRRALHRRTVDGPQHVAACNAGIRSRRLRRDLCRRDAFRACLPQHAVLDLVPLRPHRDVGDAQHEQDRHDRQRKQRSPPGEQPPSWCQLVMHNGASELVLENTDPTIEKQTPFLDPAEWTRCKSLKELHVISSAGQKRHL